MACNKPKIMAHGQEQTLEVIKKPRWHWFMSVNFQKIEVTG
jgi:hypothetical protein